MRLKHVLLLSLLLPAAAMQAQSLLNKKNYKTWSVSLGGGLMLGRTDLKQYDWYPVASYNNERRFGFYGSLNKQITPVIGLSGMIMRGNVSGTERSINQYFDADIWDFSLNAVVNLRNLLAGGTSSAKKYKFTYTFSVGAGLSQFKTKRKYLDGVNKDQTVFSYGYGEFGGPTTRTTENFTSLGVGAKYHVNNDFALGLDVNMRNLNSDKLDAIVKDQNDKYMLVSMGLTYYIGKKGAVPFEQKDPSNTMYEQLLTTQNKLDSITRDSDGDGIPDVYEGISGTAVATVPVAVDTDGDGVPDVKDEEPFSNKGATVDGYGREMDDDHDGIPNSKDLETNTPQGSLVNFQGKTIIADNKNAKEDEIKFNNQVPPPGNKNPNTQANNNNNNIPVTGGTNTGSATGGVMNRIPVYFATDNASVSSKYIENLAILALYMKANPNAKLLVTGHTDHLASAEYNQRLGLKRAEIVKAYLVRNFGIKADRIRTESKGETEPLSTTINMVNRRVEIDILR